MYLAVSITEEQMGFNDFAIDTKCPLCFRDGKSSRLVPVFYKVQEGFYTCESSTCPYFLTDNEGNPVKVYSNEAENKKASATSPSFENNDDGYLEEFFHSISNSCDNSQIPCKYVSTNSQCNQMTLQNEPPASKSTQAKINDFDIDSLMEEVLKGYSRDNNL